MQAVKHSTRSQRWSGEAKGPVLLVLGSTKGKTLYADPTVVNSGCQGNEGITHRSMVDTLEAENLARHDFDGQGSFPGSRRPASQRLPSRGRCVLIDTRVRQRVSMLEDKSFEEERNHMNMPLGQSHLKKNVVVTPLV